MPGSGDHRYTEQMRRGVGQEVLKRQHLLLPPFGNATNAEVPSTAGAGNGTPFGSRILPGISEEPQPPATAEIDMSGPSCQPTTSFGAQRLSPVSRSSAGTSEAEVTGTQRDTADKDAHPRKQEMRWQACVQCSGEERVS